MLKWAIIFFVLSLVAGFMGFTGVASTTRTIVLVFGVFLGMLVF